MAGLTITPEMIDIFVRIIIPIYVAMILIGAFIVFKKPQVLEPLFGNKKSDGDKTLDSKIM